MFVASFVHGRDNKLRRVCKTEAEAAQFLVSNALPVLLHRDSRPSSDGKGARMRAAVRFCILYHSKERGTESPVKLVGDVVQALAFQGWTGTTLSVTEC